jgi:hypothetical protein
LIAFPAQAKYSGGTGEPNDPYQIATAADLIALGETPEDYDKHFILTADIDLDPNLPRGRVFDRAVIAPATPKPDWPYYQGIPFTGVFDGNGHTISHLVIRGQDYLGLFGVLGQWDVQAEVKNLRVVDVSVLCSGNHVGGLVGQNNYCGTVTRCYCAGAVSDMGQSPGNVGGLVGENQGIMTQCCNTASVGGNENVGGLVGLNYYGTVAQCYSTGSVSGNGNVGGIVGQNNYCGTVIHCYNTGEVRGNGQNVGGLVGIDTDWTTVAQCYSTGLVSGNANVGGLVGDNYGGGSISASFWDTQASGQAESDGGTGKTTAEMEDPNTFLKAGWDFAGEIRNGTHEAWQMPEGGGYPILAILTGHTPAPLKGKGTSEDPYLVSNAMELGAMIYYNPYAHCRLAASIDLSGSCWGTAVLPFFSGNFDGDGHGVLHLKINGGGYLGLFGQLRYEAEVKSLGVVDVNIIGSGRVVGGLIGDNGYGTVTQCYSTGSISGGQNVGGLVGENRETVTQCYCTGAVSGKENVGGLVGENVAILTCCYSTGVVHGDSAVGGLAGQNCGVVTDSVWDTQTSGQTTSAGGIGKTTAEMQTDTTFLDAGWDFVGETANGTEDIWWIEEGKDYPRLWWEPRKYGGGTGEPNDPYLIYNAEDMNAISNEPNDWDRHFKLMADIDLSEYSYDAALIAPDGDSNDPAFQGTSFTGVFDGGGHAISNLTITGESYLGLFGRTEYQAQINNLSIVDVNITGTDYVGGLVGFNSSGITSSGVTGSIIGDNRIGGLAGRNWGSINTSLNAASVNGYNDVGGLTAGNYGTITNSYNTGAVWANSDVGGLVGENYGTIDKCYSTGAVSGERRFGGFVSFNWEDSIITASFWDMETSGQATSAGGSGKTTAEMQTGTTFLDAGWDFVGETANGTEDIWWIDEGQDYPRLWWELDREVWQF